MSKRFQYPKEAIQKAIEAIEKGSSVSSASKLFGVPRSTLNDKLNNRYKADARPGPATVLTTAEEELLVKWMYKLASWGFPINKNQLLDAVGELVKNLKRANNFTRGRPGKKWFNLFLKRHPDLAKRVSQNLTSSRANLTEYNIRNWFAEVRKTLVEQNFLSVTLDPTKIFNCDEAAFFLAPKENSVLVKKGSKQVYSKISNSEKECVTVLVNIRADGKIPPPMVLFNYKRIPQNIVRSMPKEWGIGISDNGWMTGQTFYEYVTNVFHPWLVKEKTELPIMLYVDGHTSHITLPLSEFCDQNGIILVALFPNSTHVLQPCDVGLFHPVKQEWKAKVKDYRWKNDGKKLDKENFASLLESCLSKAGKPSTIKNAFRTTGLFPFNENNIDYNKLIKVLEPALEPVLEPANNEHVPESVAAEQGSKADKSFFKMLESKLPSDLLTKFQMETCSCWSGDLEHKSLYEFWLKSKGDENFQNVTVTNEDLIGWGESFWLDERDTEDVQLMEDGSVLIEELVVSTSDNEKGAKIDNPTTSSANVELSPLRVQQTNIDFPTPFKKSLYWPKMQAKKSSKKSDKKLTPVVATSGEFLSYLRKQDFEKAKKEKEIIDKRVKRKIKFDAKQSENTEYPTVKKKKNKPDDESFKENAIKVADYVVVNYEGELFPGLVMETLKNNTEFKIKTMAMSGSNWKWPDRDDVYVYQLESIKKINSPGLINNRGIYSVPEIQKLKLNFL